MKRKGTYPYLITGIIILFCLGFSSCSVTRKLKKDELLLNKVKLKNYDDLSSYDLESLVKQWPNRKILGNRPYLRIHYLGKRFFDSTRVEKRFDRKIEKLSSKLEALDSDAPKYPKYARKLEDTKDKKKTVLAEGNWLMRIVGEPPVIYDTALTAKTLQQFNNYMFAHGYLNGEVDSRTKIRRKKVKLWYEFTPDEPFTIISKSDSITPDTLAPLFHLDSAASEIKVGTIFKTDVFDAERDRINILFKNNGYFHFSKNYIRFELDSNRTNHSLNVKTIVSIPKSDTLQKFYIKKVYFKTGRLGKSHLSLANYRKNGVEYYTNNRPFVNRVLDRKVFIYQDSLYNLNNTLQTQKNLADLNIFKFINVSYIENSDTTLSCLVKTTPFPRHRISTEFGVNVFQTLPGPYGNISFKTLNMLNAADIFEIGVQGLIEGQASPISSDLVYRSQEFSSSASLTFPYFVSPVKLSKKSVDIHPQTRIYTRYSYIVRPEFRRTNITSAFTYSWQKGTRQTFSVSPIEMSVVNTTDESPEFIEYLKTLFFSGNNLIQSFNRSIVTSFPVSYTYNDYEFGKIKRSRYLKLSAESGGGLVRLLNTLSGNDQNNFLGLDVFQYIKGFTDFRYYMPVRNKNTVASRISVGVAYPLGNSDGLPYEKYFFTGGSYSNRAWLPRRLGQGSDIDTLDNGETDFTYAFERPGEVIIEGNLEYRIKTPGLIDWALFVDASNVWSVNSQANENAKFRTNRFYKEIAIGAGFGMRFDFSFLVLRLDWARRIYDPALPEGKRWVNQDSGIPMSQLSVLNLGIGYPF